MDELIKFICTFVILLSIYLYIDRKQSSLIFVKSTIDNNVYLVRNVEDKQNAANLMASIRQKLDRLVDYLCKKYPDDERGFRLKKKFNPNNIEESESGSKFTSYSVNKGEKIVFCLRSKDKFANLEDENVIMFVAIHELAHIMTISIGHTEEFWNNFRFMLKEAIKMGIYIRHNFKKKPEKYCGTMITDSPLKD
jgi:predicted metal-dependent hydrolase